MFHMLPHRSPDGPLVLQKLGAKLGTFGVLSWLQLLEVVLSPSAATNACSSSSASISALCACSWPSVQSRLAAPHTSVQLSPTWPANQPGPAGGGGEGGGGEGGGEGGGGEGGSGDDSAKDTSLELPGKRNTGVGLCGGGEA